MTSDEIKGFADCKQTGCDNEIWSLARKEHVRRIGASLSDLVGWAAHGHLRGAFKNGLSPFVLSPFVLWPTSRIRRGCKSSHATGLLADSWPVVSQGVLRDLHPFPVFERRLVRHDAGDGHVQGLRHVDPRLAVPKNGIHEFAHEVAVRSAVAAGR